jgi:mitochondrial fission protein ELM1
VSVNSEKTVWVLNDGRVGHWRQASALAAYLPAAAREVGFHLKTPWRLFAPRSLPLGLAMHPCLRTGLDGEAPAAIISCGRQSALVARWLQHQLGPDTRTVQILNCGLRPERFSWVIAPLHDDLRGHNVIHSVGSLNPVDETWLGRATGDPGKYQQTRRPRVTVLLGGPSKHFDFTRSWFSRRLAELSAWTARRQGSLVLVASPRTPEWVAEAIKVNDSGASQRWVPWCEQPGTASDLRYAAVVAQADCLVVTADSVNLVSEACASGKPVFLMGWRQVRGRVERFCAHMMDQGYVLALDKFDSTAAPATVCLRETKKIASQLIDSGVLA